MTKTSSEGTGCVVVTIGHSTRTLETFISLLQTYEVKQVIDVRTVPRSRHNPQFNHDTLADDLKAADIGYLHIPGLGGLRRPKPDSINLGWRNASFRGFADYMRTPEFESHLGELAALAQRKRAALMCAEALPWRCHRSLISDAFEIRGIKVAHILSATHLQPHRMTAFARWDGKFLIYPAEEMSVE
ncbi:MAG TPA: DUF488 domain-containing protein [Thermodesulfobacteriota bacterium]|jgi:uncharacterized protein (DUF488 family)|nr:DUF488 domain-containing protein [Thermodesulfobacteriota bacterium]